ncbi:MAG: peptidoglycan-binding protein [Ilumatobacter sp.]|uniref:peptidoglycan-binding protein n=1 Tax=Ilumatobacter sp. TaxID=1967498 RepID=UPI0026016311|nr:peptidoglycan-binding protein [Ilumatobacter sp.]MDJ0768734.1 peptidoglycan-binding protein [Ilumatobacter sp.]
MHKFRTHLIRAVTCGVVLSLAPLASVSPGASADAPAVAVSGLSRGARGDAVRSVQQALVNQGVSVSGGVDGIFGPGTEAALKSFQSSQGLSATGVVDDATALALGLASSSLLGLTQGNRGDAVKQLQQQLIAAGLDPAGGADGIFGPGTAAALSSFQQQQGLAESGRVDAATAAALGAVREAPAAPAATDDAGAPAPAAPASPLVGLKIGSRGTAVQQLQQQLIDAGFRVVGGADGIFGVLTANALSSFQYSVDLPANAIVDEATASALDAAVPAGGGEATSSGDTPSGSGDSSSPLVGLKYGSLGSDVEALQRALLAAGMTVRGGADGVFGPATRAAVEQFQASAGLEQTGRVDAATATALESESAVHSVAKASPLVGLKAGSLGSSVKQLQSALMEAGVKVRGGADGIFGPATAQALREFQTSQGLEATGVVNADTIEALENPKAPVTSSTEAGGYAAYGEKGQRVADLQSALVQAGVSVRGGVDGVFGAGTSAAVMDYQRQQGLKVTGKVNDSTAAALGLVKAPAPTAPESSSVTLEVFPVQGKCYYGDTWHYPRGGGRLHLGVDIIAPEGKELYAAADGKITKVYTDYPGSLAGNGVRITMADGTAFFYAHMTQVAEGIEVGVPVRAGQLVGYVGSTGNSGTPHLHFEVHPKGGAAINPYPLVKAIDQCSNEASRAA